MERERVTVQEPRAVSVSLKAPSVNVLGVDIYAPRR